MVKHQFHLHKRALLREEDVEYLGPLFSYLNKWWPTSLDEVFSLPSHIPKESLAKFAPINETNYFQKVSSQQCDQLTTVLASQPFACGFINASGEPNP